MDIFDLEIEEFEEKVDELLNGISEDVLFKELIENGLLVDEYENEGYYIYEMYNNVWVHKTKTSSLNKILNTLLKKEKIDILEAA